MRTAAMGKVTAELSAVLETEKGQPFATPQLSFECTRLILEKILELCAAIESMKDASAEAPLYLPADKLAKRYGMTPKGIAPYLLRWCAAGEVEKIAPPHPTTGHAGFPRYRVADVDRMMKGNPNPAKR